MKVISGSFTITAIEDGENAVTYEILDDASYFRYDPNENTVTAYIRGYLYKVTGAEREVLANRQVMINDDQSVINNHHTTDKANLIVTDTNGRFSFTTTLSGLSASNTISAYHYDEKGLVATMTVSKTIVGANGSNAIRIDLDNENDSMLYDGNDNLVSGAVTSQARLYDGEKNVDASDVEWIISAFKGVNLVGGGVAQDADFTDTGVVNAWITVEGKITVNGIKESASYIQVRAKYQSNYYYAQLSIKKLVNADKYELVITPNAIAYNETTDKDKKQTINIEVYKTTVANGRFKVTSIDDLPQDAVFYAVDNGSLDKGKYVTLDNGVISLDWDYNLAKENVRFALTDDKDTFDNILDSETIPINKSKNGNNGEDAVSIVISPQNIVAKKSIDFQTYSFDVSVVKGGAKIKQGEWTVDWKVNGVYSGSYVIDGVLYFDNVTLKDVYTLHYEFILYTESIADTNLTFAVKYEGVTYPQSVRFQTLAEPEIYEIIPSSAYFTQSGEGWVNGGFEGQLVKVVGKDRYGIEGVTVEMVYTDNNGSIYVEETKETDSQGYFAFTDQIDGGWEDYGYTNAFSVRYVINQEIVAEHTVSLAKSGMKGERGAPLRISYWADGWTYYTGKNANDPYTDVVIVGDNYYLCMSNHRATSSNKPVDGSTDKTYWQKSSKIDMVATEVLLADNAHINLLSSNSINVNDSSGNPTTGLSGGDGVQLWGGGERETAKFRVYDDGDVFIEGTVKAKNLFRSLCIVWSDGTMVLDNKSNSIYYVRSTNGLEEYDSTEGTNYQSLFTVGTYVDWDELYNNGDGIMGNFGTPSSFGTDFVKTTANADMIILLDKGSGIWDDNGVAIVVLPHPEHYEGKTIQVDHSKTKGTNNAIIGCVESNMFVGSFSYSSNGFDYTTTASTMTINAGRVVQFYSTGNKWLYL